MFEDEVQVLLGATPRDILNICLGVLNLIEQLIFNHQWMSNTNLAVIAEAQGAEFVRSNGQSADHTESLRQGINALINAEDRIKNSITPVLNNNGTVGNALREVLRPLLDWSRSVRQVGENTLASAQDVARAYPQRLEGVPFEAGERGRASSVIQQLNNQAAALRARGIDPELVPNATPSIRTVVAEAEGLPEEDREAILKMTPLIVTMRQLIINQLGAAAGVVRAAMIRFLAPLGTMLDFLAAALTTLATSLTSFIVIPKFILENMLKDAGLQGPEA
jgi:hypothetical protein